MVSPQQILGPEGPLARHIRGFSVRPQQQAMATAVAAAIDDATTLIAEAGTGTGKTFAYLVPALLAGRRVIVSTGTRTLQDQLYHRDLPALAAAMGMPARTALLKGRANYLCLYRLDLALMQGRLRSRALVADLEAVRGWSGRTRSGDIAEVTDVAEDSPIWPLVTSTVDNCLGQECPAYGDCHVLRARRRAQEADLVVINHHLLFADMALKEDGFGDLLPSADAYVLDEAHQLPDIATAFFGVTLTGRQLQELARDARNEHLQGAGGLADLPACLEGLDKAVQDFRLTLGAGQQRLAWQRIKDKPEVAAALSVVGERLGEVGGWLEQAASRSRGLDNCWRRAAAFVERLELLGGDGDEQHVQWLDVHRRGFALHLTPLEIAAGFQARMGERRAAWIFASATLAVGEGFGHFAKRLGIEDAVTLRLDSPFDFASHALLYVPSALPDPMDPGYTAALVEAALPITDVCRGGVFMLFTSHRALREAAELLRPRMARPLLVQGDAPRAELLDRFRAAGDAVLLGTGSFWEGVDVRGPALSCVVIDKLPFASPADPVLQARIDSMRRTGGNPFMDHQLPAAVVSLKQGVGRLIRDVEDRGVMMLCDPRLYDKAYGRLFLASLPPMERTREWARVRAFLQAGPECPAVDHEGNRNAESGRL